MSFLKSNNQKTRQYSLTLLVLTIIAIVLFFGLRPQGWSDINNVHWLSDKKALSFQDSGIAYVDGLSIFAEKPQMNEWTIQIVVAPENQHKPGFRSILMIHSGDDRDQLALWQWGDSVIVMNGDDYEYLKQWPRISAKDVLRSGEASFLTLTSTPLGTKLFVNGALAKEIKNWQVTLPNGSTKLQLVLGNSVYGKHSWEGDLYGLAVYGKVLSQEEVQRDYEKWLSQRVFAPELMDKLLLLYTFNKDEGRLVADRTDSNQLLQLPVQQVVLKKTFLSPPGHNFLLNRSFWVDAVLNLFGFIPLGAALCYWLQQSTALPGKYAALASVGFCFSLSLGMEIGQAWLPSRDSSLSDLVLNTLGAWLGVLLLDIVLQVRTGKTPGKK